MVYLINGLIGHVVNERGIGKSYDGKCPRDSLEGQKTEGGQQATYLRSMPEEDIPYVPGS